MPRTKHKDLREACVEEAFHIVEQQGLEKLSLREVARRLGVSHQAPYKHFASRDHILAEVVSRTYEGFARHLESRTPAQDLHEDLHNMGLAYLEYALTHPLQYRLMFGTQLPDPDKHPRMMEKAKYAFSLLRNGVDALHRAGGTGAGPSSTTYDAMFIWSTLHGLAGALQSQAIQTIDLSDEHLGSVIPEVMERMGRSVFGEPGGTS